MIDIYKNAEGDFYFTVKASNGLSLVTSNFYVSKKRCREGIESLLRALNSKTANIKDCTK